jgi:hypothetical protein
MTVLLDHIQRRARARTVNSAGRVISMTGKQTTLTRDRHHDPGGIRTRKPQQAERPHTHAFDRAADEIGRKNAKPKRDT